MSTIVAGIYKGGTVELLEAPAGVREGPVQVILVPDQESPAAPRVLQYGKYAHGNLSTEEDFRLAEWHRRVAVDDECR